MRIDAETAPLYAGDKMVVANSAVIAKFRPRQYTSIAHADNLVQILSAQSYFLRFCRR